MFCPKCGTELKDEMVVCPQCGAVVSPVAPAAKESSGLAVAALVLSILGFLTGFLLIGMVLDVVAIVLGVLVFRKARKTPTKTGMALAGIIVAAFSLVLCLIIFLPGLLEDPAGDLYKEAKGYYDDGSYTQAIDTANEVLDEYPGTRAADKAEDLIEKCEAALPAELLADMEAAMAAEEWDRAASLGQELLEDYPDSPEAAECWHRSPGG